jgi:hypothetical protein
MRRVVWLPVISILLLLTACGEDKSAEAPKPKAPPEKPEWYDTNLASCLATGGDACNYDVLTREDRARVLAATGHNTSMKSKNAQADAPTSGCADGASCDGNPGDAGDTTSR